MINLIGQYLYLFFGDLHEGFPVKRVNRFGNDFHRKMRKGIEFLSQTLIFLSLYLCI